MPPKQSKLTDFGKKKASVDEVVDVDAVATGAPTKKSRTEAKNPPTSTASIAAPSEGAINLLSLITEPQWRDALTPALTGPLGRKIEAFLDDEINTKKNEVFPPQRDIFAALNVLPLDKIKVVLIGQDPYHDNNQAHGLCFSVMPGIKTPPSLVNMYKELTVDIPGFKTPNHGYLMKWAEKEGILMLNATLTVEAHKANSHAKCGWQDLTDEMIKIINKQCKDVVFLLWGGFAQKKGKIIDIHVHKTLSVAHPSPLSAKLWHGCRCFSKCNEMLVSLGKEPVDWHLPLNV